MKGLLSTDNIIVFEASRITFGIYDEPDVEKYALYDANDNLMYYALGQDLTLIDFDETLKPADYEPYKYKYVNGEFVLNPDWIAPPMPIEEIVSLHDDSIDDLYSALAETDLTAVSLFEQLLLQSDINLAQDEALISIYEMIGG